MEPNTSNIDARSTVRYEFHAKAISAKTGREVDFGDMNKKFSFWWRVVKWNYLEEHYSALWRNFFPEFFTKVLF